MAAFSWTKYFVVPYAIDVVLPLYKYTCFNIRISGLFVFDVFDVYLCIYLLFHEHLFCQKWWNDVWSV